MARTIRNFDLKIPVGACTMNTSYDLLPFMMVVFHIPAGGSPGLYSQEEIVCAVRAIILPFATEERAQPKLFWSQILQHIKETMQSESYTCTAWLRWSSITAASHMHNFESVWKVRKDESSDICWDLKLQRNSGLLCECTMLQHLEHLGLTVKTSHSSIESFKGACHHVEGMAMNWSNWHMHDLQAKLWADETCMRPLHATCIHVFMTYMTWKLMTFVHEQSENDNR